MILELCLSNRDALTEKESRSSKIDKEALVFTIKAWNICLNFMIAYEEF